MYSALDLGTFPGFTILAIYLLSTNSTEKLEYLFEPPLKKDFTDFLILLGNLDTAFKAFAFDDSFNKTISKCFNVFS